VIPGRDKGKGIDVRERAIVKSNGLGGTRRWRAELIRNRVSRNRFRSDGLARVCGLSRYYVGKLIILSIMPDLCPGRAATCPMARALQELLPPDPPGIIDSVFSFLRGCRRR
jgi:hypothetical protein